MAGAPYKRTRHERRDATLSGVTAPAADHDALFAKWSGWLDQLNREMIWLHLHRDIWRKLTDAIVKEAPESSSVFIDHYKTLYVGGICMAIRRLLDKDDQSVSLRRLLVDVQRNPQAMSVDRWASRLPADLEENWRQRDLADFIGAWAPNGRHVDPSIVTADIAALDEQCEAVVHYATRRHAHLDQRGSERELTFSDIHESWSSLLRCSRSTATS
jgi:hypothetical protein